jgi:hypothetical protein
LKLSDFDIQASIKLGKNFFSYELEMGFFPLNALIRVLLGVLKGHGGQFLN